MPETGPAASPDPLRLAAALAAEPHLALLDGGPGASAVLVWGQAPRPIHRLADLPQPSTGSARATAGWPEAITGGGILQLDYECPVGPWAAALAGDGGPVGWYWPLTHACSWDADGRFHRHGISAEEVAALLAAAPSTGPAPPRLAAELRPAWERAGHRQRVAAIRAAIARGDCYQANLTLPWTAPLRAGPGADLALYRRLREHAPGVRGALLRTPRGSIISHSPECYLECDGAVCLSEPIKGTRVRDAAGNGRRELLAAAKDHAELAMIVDLVRNDLGRVARRGGVRVPEPRLVLDLPYVHHLAARISAELRPGTDVHALLAATFPAGSITGAPKIAAMQLLAELEAGPRGPYCGCIGWIGAGARCSLSVAIRSLVLGSGEIRIHAGGGIVADSDGDAEWAEALAKSAPMRAAVADAG